ncbi:MAG: BON domain-containing protein [Bdellovibrionota bacterium]
MKKLLVLLVTACVLVASPAFAADRSMTNKNDAEYSDTWLEAKLDTTYTFNSHLALADIDTDVREQTAYLTGSVNSEVKKDLAGEIAKSIKGMKAVDNKIVVKNDSKVRENDSNSFSRTVSNLTTTASVKTKLIADSNINGFDINVDTNGSQVTLKGEVETSEQSALAEQLAMNTDGVNKVRNELKITKQ